MPSYWQRRTTVAAAIVIILCLLKSRRRRRRSVGRIAKKNQHQEGSEYVCGTYGAKRNIYRLAKNGKKKPSLKPLKRRAEALKRWRREQQSKEFGRRSVPSIETNQEKKKLTRRKAEEKREEEETRRITETSSSKSYNLRRRATSHTPRTETGSNISQGETSQDAVSLTNNSDPCSLTPKIDIKEEIDVDEEEWKIRLKEEKEEEEPTGKVECITTKVKIEPDEEEEELEPVASVTIPSLYEDLLEEY